jgi:hypothetical protein
MPQTASYAPFRRLPPGSRILIAFSGGVDSAVTAALALRAGFQVTAVHMTLLPGGEDSRWKAEETAAKLGIELVRADCTKAFEQSVLRPSWDMYKSGFTPNPCAICNPKVKFGALMPLMEQYGLNKVTIPERPSVFCDAQRCQEILAELKESQAELLVLLGDIPIAQFLNAVADVPYHSLQEYVDLYGYGTATEAVIGGRTIKVLPLAHPRQIGALGAHSEKWNKLHQEWESNLNK